MLEDWILILKSDEEELSLFDENEKEKPEIPLRKTVKELETNKVLKYLIVAIQLYFTLLR